MPSRGGGGGGGGASQFESPTKTAVKWRHKSVIVKIILTQDPRGSKGPGEVPFSVRPWGV